jgi:DNA repair protein RadC
MAAPARVSRFVSVEALDEEATLTRLLGRVVSGPERAELLADALLSRFGGVGRVIGAPRADLARIVGEAVADDLGELHALLLRVLEHPLRRRPALASWTEVEAYLRARLRALPREAFHVLFLDVKNQLIADVRMGEGTTNHAPVYPREVVRQALAYSAHALLLAHNHPSGDPGPSTADIEMTRQIVVAAKALGIAVHDHLIVGGDQITSLKRLGLM